MMFPALRAAFLWHHNQHRSINNNTTKTTTTQNSRLPWNPSTQLGVFSKSFYVPESSPSQRTNGLITPFESPSLWAKLNVKTRICMLNRRLAELLQTRGLDYKLFYFYFLFTACVFIIIILYLQRTCWWDDCSLRSFPARCLLLSPARDHGGVRVTKRLNLNTGKKLAVA